MEASKLSRLAVLSSLAAILGTGCHLPSLLYFLAPLPEPKQEPTLCALADKDKEVKALILTHADPLIRHEFSHSDYELTDLLAGHLRRRFQDNKEKVTLVSTRKVDHFKDTNPDWRQNQKIEDIGKHFGVDYVIFLEIDSLNLYEKGSSNTLYRGRASIAVSLYDLNSPDDYPRHRQFVCEYPPSTGPVPTDDRHGEQFRQAFLNYVARELSFYFAAYPLREKMRCE